MSLGKGIGLKMEDIRIYFEIRTEFLYRIFY